MKTKERTEPSPKNELTVVLWLIAVLLGQFLALVWFFGQLY
jgi:hypothetical protein